MLRHKYSILILLGLLVNFYFLFIYSVVPKSDFEQDYSAAIRLLHGLSIYNEGVNGHPPFNALFFSPLTFLPFQGAFIVLGSLSLAVLWLNALMIENGLGLNRTSSHIIFAFSLFWPATLSLICLGQSSALWGGAVTAGWLCEKRNRPIAAGIFLGFAILIKLIPALIVIMWYLNKRHLAALSATMVVFAGFLLMLALVGFDDIMYFFFTRAPGNTSFWIDFYGNVSISSAAEKLFGSNGGFSKSLIEAPILSRFIAVIGCSGIVLTAMIISSIRPTEETKWFNDYRTALVIVTMLLVSPITWEHYYVVLLLPLALLLSTADKENTITLKYNNWILFSVLLLFIPLAVYALTGPDPNLWKEQPVTIQLLALTPTIGLFILWTLLTRKILIKINR